MNDIFEIAKQIIILIPSIATIVAFWFLVIKSIADGVFVNYPVKKKDIADDPITKNGDNKEPMSFEEFNTMWSGFYYYAV